MGRERRGVNNSSTGGVMEKLTAILPVVIKCPPSAFFSNVSRAADRSVLGTLTFADQHYIIIILC